MWSNSRLYLLIALAALTLLGCRSLYLTATRSTIFNTLTGASSPCTPGTTPAPGEDSGTLPPGSFIRIGLFGQSCPSGCHCPSEQQPANQDRLHRPDHRYAQGLRQGNDLPVAVHGRVIAWSVPAGSGLVIVLADSEPFNRSARCQGAGVFTLAATVKGVVGSADFECITGAVS